MHDAMRDAMLAALPPHRADAVRLQHAHRYARTDVRTDEETTHGRDQSPGPYPGRPYDDQDESGLALASLGELCIDWLDQVERSLDQTRERWPRIRTGQRAEIPAELRRMVYERDGHACRRCLCTGWPLTLDHIVPWSAGGSDTSANLRTLCWPCNAARSNWYDAGDQLVTPVTRMCLPCMSEGWEREARSDDERILAYCGTCGLTSTVPTDRWLL